MTNLNFALVWLIACRIVIELSEGVIPLSPRREKRTSEGHTGSRSERGELHVGKRVTHFPRFVA